MGNKLSVILIQMFQLFCILYIYFDSTSDDNLDIESIYTLNEGLALMFKKIALRHGA